MLGMIQMFYNDVFSNLKEYIVTNSQYKPYVFKQEPKDSVFPLVVVKDAFRNGTYTTLNYKDEKYTYSISINIYATTSNGISGRTVCEELTQIIERFFKEEMRMSVNVTPTAPNIDEAVDRTIINVTCYVDTKYKDKLVYSPIQ